MSGAFLQDELLERFERTKTRLETDTQKLRDISYSTSLKVACHKHSLDRRKGANEEHDGQCAVHSATRDKNVGRLDHNMINFSKNVGDRRASSVLSCHFSANRILANKDAELTDEVAKPSLRQLLTVDDKYRGKPPTPRRHTKERSASKVSAPATLQSARVESEGEQENEEDARLYAPRPNRLDVPPKLRHVISYREAHTVE